MAVKDYKKFTKDLVNGKMYALNALKQHGVKIFLDLDEIQKNLKENYERYERLLNNYIDYIDKARLTDIEVDIINYLLNI